MSAPSPTIVHNERIKLLAGAVNNLALAVIAWLAMGAVLHLVAQAALGRLKP